MKQTHSLIHLLYNSFFIQYGTTLHVCKVSNTILRTLTLSGPKRSVFFCKKLNHKFRCVVSLREASQMERADSKQLFFVGRLVSTFRKIDLEFLILARFREKYRPSKSLPDVTRSTGHASRKGSLLRMYRKML